MQTLIVWLARCCPRGWGGLALLLLGIHAAVAVVSLLQQSPSIDEFGQLPAGISHWQKGAFFVYRVNPPLVKMLAALPVLAAKPNMPYPAVFRPAPGERAEWGLGRDFMEANRDRYFHLFFLGRLPMVVLSVLGGWLLFLWGRELYGPAAGLLATALWCSCPNVLTWAQTITPDIGATTATLAAGYCYWHWLKRPTWARTAGCGVLLGVAQLTKFTSLVLYPVWLVLWLCWLLGRSTAASEGPHRNHGTALGEGHVPSAGRQFAQLAGIFLLSLFVLNLGYGFQGSCKPLGDFEFISEALTAEHLRSAPAADVSAPTGVTRYRVVVENRFRGTWLGGLVVPLPEQYLLGIDQQKSDFENPIMMSYLRGELRRRGWWYYYLYGLGVKLPLGTLALLALALALAVSPKYRAAWPDELAALLPGAAVLAFVSSQTGFNHHLRYVLPAFPALFLGASRLGRLLRPDTTAAPEAPGAAAVLPQVAAASRAAPVRLGSPDLPRPARWRRLLAAGVVLCLVWNVAAAARIHPHYMSYFNELAGGPDNGHRHLLDSNIEWGQDLLFLKAWLDQHPEARPLGLAYRNMVDPTVAGISFEFPPAGPRGPHPDPQTLGQDTGPRPGWYAVSVSFIYGLALRIPDGKGGTETITNELTYFQHFRPVAKAGYSIFIYHITLEEANAVRQQLGLPPLKAP